MKKFVLILGLVLALSTHVKARDIRQNVLSSENIASTSAEQQKFVNPIFYQPLRPLSSTVGWTYLTPTSIKSMTPLGKNLVDSTGQCRLIENSQDRITLLCTITWRDEKWMEYHTYVIKDVFLPSCLRILEYTYKKIEEFSSNEMHAAKYCVTPPNYTPSESD
ncbi:MAG: hypothetical protein IJ852_01275 [Alphaproteobacteria bacterium]|nr:hypothetical protein [Alphaproteobacteria bacterium]